MDTNVDTGCELSMRGVIVAEGAVSLVADGNSDRHIMSNDH